MIFIGYRVEETLRGWTVLRKRSGEKEAIHVKQGGSTVRIQYFKKRAEAIEEIGNQVKHDRAAATRLGLEVDESTAIDGTVLSVNVIEPS